MVFHLYQGDVEDMVSPRGATTAPMMLVIFGGEPNDPPVIIALDHELVVEWTCYVPTFSWVHE